MFERQETCI